MTMKTIFLNLMCFVSVLIQLNAATTKENCLKKNPGVLHGEFKWYNKLNNPWTVTVQELQAMINLFSSRFKNAYVFDGIDIENLDPFFHGFINPERAKTFHPSYKVYISNNPGSNDRTLNKTIGVLKQYSQLINDTNRVRPGTIGGMLVRSYLPTYDDILLAVESVFGPIESADLEIGFLVSEAEFQKTNRFFQKLKFIVITMEVNIAINPQRLVDSIVRRCDFYKEDAKSRNINAKILCRVYYPSEGVDKLGNTGDIGQFHSFWCGLVSRLISGGDYGEFIMKSAFDESPTAFENGEGSSNPYSTKFHEGWWKRESSSLLNESAYVEKIENFKNALEDEIVTGNSADSSQPCSYLGLVIGLCISTLIIVILIVCLIWCHFRNNHYEKNVKLTSEDVQLFEKGKLDSVGNDNNEEGLLAPYDTSFEVPKSSLIINTSILLGKGEHGAVYSGSLTTMKENVAVKSTCKSLSTESAKQLLTEIKIFIHVGKHTNLINFIGAYTAEKVKGNVSLVLELCELGSLINVLRQPEKLSLLTTSMNDSGNGERVDNIIQILGRKWAREIACGMNHIASKNVIHGDLAARNVLITRSGQAKITDFGLSRKLYSYSNYVKQKQEPLPWRWMAPESLKHMTFSTESDVWAYGITLFEIFSCGVLPYPGMVWDYSFVEILESGFKNSKPEFSSELEYEIMQRCWQVIPSMRPTFKSLLDEFESHGKESLQYVICNETEVNT